MAFTLELVILVAVLLLVGYGIYRKQAGPTRGKHALETYTTDLTAQARAGKLDPICCRDVELERVVHILLRRTKNNPLLIGAAGVGKSAIVEGFAQRVVAGEVPEALHGARVLALRVHDLLAGTRYRGEFEERIRGLLHALESAPVPVILFIDEAHLLEQSGRSEGSLSLVDVLKPGLARGDFRVIGATTWKEYEEYFRPNETLERRFQPVLVDEPSRERALQMLKGIRSVYEEHHGVRITDAALETAVRLADEDIDTRKLPDSAIDLIDEAAAKVAIEAEREHHLASGAVHAAAKRKGGANHTNEVPTVEAGDVQEVVDQWIVHGREDRVRDARAT